jgi:hypothetical protein
MSSSARRPAQQRQLWQLNGSRQSIVEDDPNAESRVMILSSALTSPVQIAFSPFIAAAPHLTTILHTDTSDAESVSVKSSGAPSTLWTRDDVLELPALPLI